MLPGEHWQSVDEVEPVGACELAGHAEHAAEPVAVLYVFTAGHNAGLSGFMTAVDAQTRADRAGAAVRT